MPRRRTGRLVTNGSVRMAETGKKPVQCWFTTDEKEELEAAAKRCGIPVATFVTRLAIAASRDMCQFAFASEFQSLITRAVR
jgi:hypothetical protein